MNVVFVSSEVAPFSKTGGLADVSGALPGALKAAGVNVSIVTPMYRCVDVAKFALAKGPKSVSAPVDGRAVEAEVLVGETVGGVPVFFVRCDEFFDREALYSTRDGDYDDNAQRFAFFCRAVLEVCRRYRLNPDIIHCNDWQAALLPVFNERLYRRFFGTVLTIHNIGYQGAFSKNALRSIGLDWDLFTPEGVEFYGQVNLLKGGLLFADRLTTVSASYAREITTPEYGHGMDGVLRFRGDALTGILNGVDYSEWSPQTDIHIPSRFSPDAEEFKGKASCKTALQEAFGLPHRADAPLIGIVSRLAAQKGFDILFQAVERLIERDVQLVVLGTGDKSYEDGFARLEEQHPGRVGVKIALSNPMAHLIEAGADFFLMPSRYEPCGLNQLYSLKYGTIPIVRATGGLDDSIEDVDAQPDTGNGFKFAEYSAEAMLDCVDRALKRFRNKRSFQSLQKRAMKQDFSWARSAAKYVALYEDLLSAL